MARDDLDIFGKVFLESCHLGCFAGRLTTNNRSNFGSCIAMLDVQYVHDDGIGHTFTIFTNNLANELGFHTVDDEIACPRDKMTVVFDRDIRLFNTEYDIPKTIDAWVELRYRQIHPSIAHSSPICHMH